MFSPATEVKLSTPIGTFVGIEYIILETKERVRHFLGIRYGQAPIGDLRFQPPQPTAKQPPSSEIDARHKGKSCFGSKDDKYGTFSGSHMWNPKGGMSEDCLNLNIWVPAKVKASLPVMVWIFGGGFFSGSPSLALYDGSVLAASQQVVVININYRLGPFGFLFFGQGSASSGNMGLLDQQLSLRWIQDNVAAFGGDPARVTLFGESAGAASVSAHLISPGSRDLFSQAIMQSGAITNTWAYSSPKDLLDKSQEMAQNLNCNSSSSEEILFCLRELSAKVIQAHAFDPKVKMMQFPFVPVSRDGQFFPEDLFDYIQRRDFKKCPVIIGTNKDDGSFWLSYYLPDQFKFDPDRRKEPQPNEISKNQYLNSVNLTFEEYVSSQKFLKMIASQYSDQAKQEAEKEGIALRNGVSQFFGDFFFTCDVWNFADSLVEAGVPVYLYYFTQRSSANDWPIWMGAMHGYEIEVCD